MAHQKVKRAVLQPSDVFSPTNHPGDVGFSFAATTAAKKQCPGNCFIMKYSIHDVSITQGQNKSNVSSNPCIFKSSF